ncbi:hypothetical protein [Lentzea sp. NBRC 102530]|uniref:hypothetical protein n=1 Tax=Lentzea sp. NBRC 102530 TaxID=3032201 RepID=UPI0024A0F02B|nr:hypothetical protein [Lentzea sp. NBRC 102530]GLY47372.1 hypothetical protein Lesp01_10280 [Lentzea sp. NBRC 102530]
MTGLRIELRRSTALWAGLVVLASGTGMLWLITSEGSLWKGNSTSAVLEFRFPIAYVWALVVGLATLQGMRDSRAGVTELFATTAKPAWRRLGTLAGSVAGVVAVAAALLCLGLVARVAFTGGFVSIGFVPLALTAVLALASSTLLGLAIGRMLPHPLTVPVALVATFMIATTAGRALEVRSPGDEISALALLTPVMDPPESDLVTTSTSVDLGQLAWFTGLGVTAFLLLVNRGLLGRLAALVPAGLALALALAIMPAKFSDVIVSDSIASKLVCDDDVCVGQAHAEHLPAVAEAGKAALAKLAVLPGAPKAVHEDTSAMAHLTPTRRDERVVYLNTNAFPRTLRMTPDEIRLELLAGAGVASCSVPSSFNTFEGTVRYVTAGYFNGELVQLPSEPHMWANDRLRGEIDETWRQFRSQPDSEQLERVTEVRRMMLACEDPERMLDVLKAGR